MQVVLSKDIKLGGIYIVSKFHNSSFSLGWKLFNYNCEVTTKKLKFIAEKLRPQEGNEFEVLEEIKIKIPGPKELVTLKRF